MNITEEHLLSVTFLNIEEFQDKVIVHFYYEETHQWAFVRNREVLCGRLIQGTVIQIKRYPLLWKNTPVYEASLIINDDDMLPEDLIPLLINQMPAYRTSFGFISEPAEGEGRYYALFKQECTGMLLCTGKYRINGDLGTCLNFDGEWKIRNGLIENFFLNQNWAENPVSKWKHDFFLLSDTVDYLSKEYLNLNFRDYITDNNLLEFFYADDWSPEFYRNQAKLGFIAITHKRNGNIQLLPQLQSAYAVLDWENLTIDKKVRKIMKGSRIENEDIKLCIDSDPEVVLGNLSSTWEETSWLVPSYENTIKVLASAEEREKDKTFRIWGVTLTAGKEQKIIAGELGYTIGKTYTSLSGFFKRDMKEYNNFGKLQMVMLAEVMKDAGIIFWNLGHPHMQYKIDLGAAVLPRKDFLERWDRAVIGNSVDLSRM